MNYKNITSVSITEMSGQKMLVYSFDEIDDQGRIVKSNEKDSRVIIKNDANQEILNVITKLEDYAETLVNK